MSAPTVALGDMPSPQERLETGKLALSIVELVQRGPAGAADLHALLQTMTLRELALTLGSMGALWWPRSAITLTRWLPLPAYRHRLMM